VTFILFQVRAESRTDHFSKEFILSYVEGLEDKQKSDNH